MSDKTRAAIAARLARNRAATGVAIRAPKEAPKKTKAPKVEEPVVEKVVEEEPSGAEG
jgi:hypothetical protein